MLLLLSNSGSAQVATLEPSPNDVANLFLPGLDEADASCVNPGSIDPVPGAMNNPGSQTFHTQGTITHAATGTFTHGGRNAWKGPGVLICFSLCLVKKTTDAAFMEEQL